MSRPVAYDLNSLRDISRNMAMLRGVGGGKVAFTPASLPGLALWLDATAITGLVDADPVGTWSDQSGNGRDATQATAAKKPTYKTNIQNGKPVVRFDSIDDGLSVTMSLAAGSWSCYAVVLVPSATTAGNYVLDAETGRLIFSPRDSDDNTKVGWYDGLWKDIAAITSGWKLLAWILTSGGNGEVFVDGVSKGTAAYSAQAIGGAIAIGTRYNINGTNNLRSDLGEFALYSGAHTVADRQQLENYYNTKWAVY